MITICFIYFRSLTLVNLRAALYSLRQQDFSKVAQIIVLDNNTEDTTEEIEYILQLFSFPVPTVLFSHKHGKSDRTHAWSTNAAVREVVTPWVFFTRADYLLAFDTLQRFAGEMATAGFITANGSHLDLDAEQCEHTRWRDQGPSVFRGTPYDYTCIDTGVWLGRKEDFDAVGGLDEGLTVWGHAQTHFQWKLHKAGVEFARIPRVMFYHPAHGGEKDIVLANQQIVDRGLSLQEMWARYPGPKVY